ncbi:Serine--tRNA ligase [Bienertia sinuspersici]
MTPNKDWMAIVDYINDESYKAGVDSFLDFAFQKLGTETIRCLCLKCLNIETGDRDKVRNHLLVYRIVKRYTFWYHHGKRRDEPQSMSIDGDGDFEGNENQDEMLGMLRDLYPQYNNVSSPYDENNVEERNDDAKRFYSLLKDSKDPVYEGCNSSRMSALLKLLHIKTLGRWSNELFTMLLEFLVKELLPGRSKLPDSYYDSKKILKDLGLSYQKINACINDCMLYWRENEELDSCKVCGASRWKIDKRNREDKCNKKGKRIPQKTLRYFPLKQRLQRLYMCSKPASLTTWHRDNKSKPGIMKHPVDGSTWQSFDKTHGDFTLDPRNIRLGLATDGFQPFRIRKHHIVYGQ